MSEPLPLRDMDPDERQLLKEAVCDAILERTRRMVSGDGEAGRTILGGRPSRVLSSGFILPRINENGDDEANDIRLAAHGLDLRVRPVKGTLRMSPTLAVYVRTFPTADDLFARDGRLIPRADLSKPAGDQAKDQIRQRMEQEGAGISGRARRELRANIAAQVYREMGVVVPDGAVIAGPAETDPELSQTAQPNAGVQRLRIPNRISRRYDVPLKWRRIDVSVPRLELSLPVDDNAWQAAASDYTSRLHAAIRVACQSYIDSSEGGEWAWRRRRPESEDFWTPAAWDSFLQRARQDRPTAADIIPQIQLQFLVQAIPDPSAVGCHSVRVALENIREIDSDQECGLFNVSIALEPAVIKALSLTFFWATGAFTAYPFIAPYLHAAVGFGDDGVSVAVFVWGVSAVVGMTLGGSVNDRFGSPYVIGPALALLTLAFLALAATAAFLSPDQALIPVMAAIILWGIAVWGFYPAQMAHLINAGGLPEASITLSLNTSVMYAGFGVGSALGSAIIASRPVQVIGLAAAGSEVIGLILFVFYRLTGRSDG